LRILSCSGFYSAQSTPLKCLPPRLATEFDTTNVITGADSGATAAINSTDKNFCRRFPLDTKIFAKIPHKSGTFTVIVEEYTMGATFIAKCLKRANLDV